MSLLREPPLKDLGFARRYLLVVPRLVRRCCTEFNCHSGRRKDCEAIGVLYPEPHVGNYETTVSVGFHFTSPARISALFGEWND